MKKFEDFDGFEQSTSKGKRKTHYKEEGIEKSKPKSKKPWTKKHERYVDLDEDVSA